MACGLDIVGGVNNIVYKLGNKNMEVDRMNDKEKQIEEMCRDVVPFLVKEEFVEEILKDPLAHFTATSLKEYVELFEELIRLNYRKILEGEVVLTREEYNNMQFVTEFIGTKQKIGACDFNRVFLQHERKIRKETAEKILREIGSINLDDIGIKEMVLAFKITKKIDELAKQFGVEVEE